MRKKNIQKSNQKSKERKLLVATLALAALIVGGSTFAWFTSTDLVTNKLSSTGGLRVVATESFDRPDNWTPEVTVKKEVGALNAGNIDAFVRLSLPNTQATVTRLSDGATVNFNAINAEALKDAKEITRDEAIALQAGAYLVFSKNALVDDSQEQTINSSTLPDKTGLYIFRRKEGTETVNGVTKTTYEYSGYVYDETGDKFYLVKAITDEEGKYNSAKYVTETKNSEVPEVNYTKVNSDNFITVTYKDAEGMNPIVIKINLDDNWKDSWGFNDKNGYEKFYYKKVLTSGNKTPNLIKSVKLEADQDAYYAFDYNLDVKIESIQIGTGDANGNGKANEVADIVVPVNEEWKEEVTATYNYSTDGKYSPLVDDVLTWTFK